MIKTFATGTRKEQEAERTATTLPCHPLFKKASLKFCFCFPLVLHRSVYYFASTSVGWFRQSCVSLSCIPSFLCGAFAPFITILDC